MNNKQMNTASSVLENIKKNLAENKSIECVFDLDSTLFNVSPRSQKILNEFSELHNHDHLKKVLVRTEDWGLKEAVERHGYKKEDHLELHENLVQYWRRHFFSNEYLHYDTPYKGAVRFVQFLEKQGVHVSYLTGRDIPRMQLGTIAVLKKWGFPYSENRLFMKPHKELNDKDFKLNWFLENIKNKDEFYFFENEPVNTNAVGEKIPAIHQVFLDTTHSRKETVRVPHTKMTHFYIEGL